MKNIIIGEGFQNRKKKLEINGYICVSQAKFKYLFFSQTNFNV